MKLSKCKYGTIVAQTTDGLGNASNSKNVAIGMIVGITNDCPRADTNTRSLPENAIAEVRWADGSVSGIHPAYIKPYKD